jgi:hypothetical protein
MVPQTSLVFAYLTGVMGSDNLINSQSNVSHVLCLLFNLEILNPKFWISWWYARLEKIIANPWVKDDGSAGVVVWNVQQTGSRFIKPPSLSTLALSVSTVRFPRSTLSSSYQVSKGSRKWFIWSSSKEKTVLQRNECRNNEGNKSDGISRLRLLRLLQKLLKEHLLTREKLNGVDEQVDNPREISFEKAENSKCSKPTQNYTYESFGC